MDFYCLAALIVGVMLYPDAIKTITDLGTTWLGLAVSAAYAYFGINPTTAAPQKAPIAGDRVIGNSAIVQKVDEGKISFDAGKPELKD